MDKQKEGLASEIFDRLENISEEICNNLCKYRETSDEDLICDYMREHGECPLDKLL